MKKNTKIVQSDMYKHGYKYYSVLLKAKGEQTTVCARNEKMSTSSGTRRWSDQIPATMERRNDWRRLFFYLRVFADEEAKPVEAR